MNDKKLMHGSHKSAFNKKAEAPISTKTLNLPKGGGAISSIGDQLRMDEFTGSASFSVPIVTSSCRDFSPTLNITYASSGGNGEWGIGCSLNLPSIARRTNLGVPKYNNEDTFLLTGADYLVPFNKQPTVKSLNGINYNVCFYKPSIENVYNWIEFWQTENSSSFVESFWRVIHHDHTIEIFGKTEQARIADPKQPNKVFQWLLEEVYDAKGQHQLYFYKAENNDNVDSVIYENNREQITNKYIQFIRYGNKIPVADSMLFTDDKAMSNPVLWHFEVVFDYGEYNTDLTNENPYQPVKSWLYRIDPFSNYHAGFEIRTRRLCQKILMFHRFENEFGTNPVLVHVTKYNYQTTKYANLSQLTSIQDIGYSYLLPNERKGNNPYIIKERPAINFSFQDFVPEGQEFNLLSVNNHPLTGLNNHPYTLIDLFGEGIPGILYNDGQTVCYQDPQDGKQAKYSAPNILLTFPIEYKKQGGKLTLMDINNNGRLDIVVTTEKLQGFYEAQPNRSWQNYHDFKSCPIQDIPYHWVDLSGNGLSDLVQIDQGQLKIYPAKRFLGWEKSYFHSLPDNFPPDLIGDEKTVIMFADMTGSGLAQLIKINDAKVTYWPTLGYGSFGNAITMENAPSFGNDFSANQLFLADIDGSGTADLIYATSSSLYIYINQSGNKFAVPIILPLPAEFDRLSQIQFADIFGNGTNCLIFSKLDNPEEPKYWYYDFCQQLKPYLLNQINNQRGSSTEIYYNSSVEYYLKDKREGKVTESNLPFPVHVVSKIVHKDEITSSTLVSEYSYHNGYYDEIEREFRGFGRVEKIDTEHFFSSQKIGESEYVAPARVKTWYHTGAQDNTHSRQYANEYYAGDSKAFIFPDSTFENSENIDPETLRQFYRTLKGQMLRNEIYAFNSEKQSTCPYSVNEINYQIFLEQKKGNNPYAIFQIYPKENITYNYERNPQDPQIHHQFNLEVDNYGNITLSCNVSYGRRLLPSTLPQQQLIQITCNLVSYINQTDTADNYAVSIPLEEKQYQIHNVIPDQGKAFDFNVLAGTIDEILKTLSLKQPSSDNATLLGWQRHYYAEATSQETKKLPFGEISLPIIPFQTLDATFVQSEAEIIFKDILTSDELQTKFKKGYYTNTEIVENSNYWWNPHNTEQYFGLQGFFLPKATQDVAENVTTYSYDIYNLLLKQIIDPIQNTTSVERIDYKLLQPQSVIDINGNYSEVLFDPLGQVIYTSHYGIEQGQKIGFAPVSEVPAVQPSSLQDIITNPESFIGNQGSYFYYDEWAWINRKEPIVTLGLVAENYPSAVAVSPIRINLVYTDGFGRELQNKMKVEAGDAYIYNLNTGKVDPTPTYTENRWLTSGRKVYNNKGNPVKNYEPYYLNVPDFISDTLLDTFGITPIFYYDPLERLIKTQTPKGFFNKHSRTAWESSVLDENDSILEAPYYLANNPASPDPNSPFYDKDILPAEKQALSYAAKYFSWTPTTTIIDSNGQILIERKINKYPDANGVIQEKTLDTNFKYDILGRLLSTIDPRLAATGKPDNLSLAYCSLKGEALKTISVDAGTSWIIHNVFGQPIYSSNARQVTIETEYDALQRPIQIQVTKSEQDIDPLKLNQVVERFVYGEGIENENKNNLRGKLYQHYDQAGLVNTPSYSLLGKSFITNRQLLKDYQSEVNWNTISSELLQDKIYTQYSIYDASGRIIQDQDSDSNLTNYAYYISGRLNKVTVTTKDDGQSTDYVKSITYNAKNQRTEIEYGNGTTTQYQYEYTTQRLRTIKTNTVNNTNQLQSLQYQYDPVGNIVEKEDQNQIALFYNNQEVSPIPTYTYDALYQLIAATGREAIGQAINKDRNNKIKLSSIHSKDLQALQNYTELYNYDNAGNLYTIKHTANQNSWTKDLIVSDSSNRAVISIIDNKEPVPQDVNNYFDASGNQIKMQSIYPLCWDYRNQLQKAVTVQRQDDADSDCEYYVYNSSGQRIRKIYHQFASGHTVVNITAVTYLGNLEIRQTLQGENIENAQVMEEYHSLRIMDDKRSIATRNHWVIGTPPTGIKNQAIRYNLEDQLNSSAAEVDENGKVISIEEYYPYGGSALFNSEIEASSVLKHYRYSGKERDSITGLYYYGARYYASWLGRWLNPDPAGSVDGLNLYAFVNGNPINYEDHDGLARGQRKCGICGKTGHIRTNTIHHPKTNSLKKIKRKEKFKFSDITVTSAMLSEVDTFKAITAQGKKRPLLDKEAHIKLINKKFKTAQDMEDHITLFRVDDKKALGPKETKEHTVPGPNWTPPSSVGFVMGALNKGHRIRLATEPTSKGLSGTQGEPSIYARETMTALMHGWTPRAPKPEEQYGKTGRGPKIVLTPPSSPIRINEDDMAKIFDVNETWNNLPSDLSKLKSNLTI